MNWYKTAQNYGYKNLAQEVAKYRGTGGISSENQDIGFLPAFRHKTTGEIFPSLRIDGSPASVHSLEGIPDKYIIERDKEPWNKQIPYGQVLKVVDDIEAGFIKNNKFYTRDEAANESTR